VRANAPSPHLNKKIPVPEGDARRETTAFEEPWTPTARTRAFSFPFSSTALQATADNGTYLLRRLL
jgi:hypothetical protein